MKKIFTLLCGLVLAASLFAQLPYNTTMTQSHYNNSSVVVGSDGSNYSKNKWDGGIYLEAGTYKVPLVGTISGSEFNWDDKFVIVALNQTSIPYQLTFKYQSSSSIASDPNWYVAESESKNGPWVNVWTATTPTSSSVSVSTDEISLPNPINLSKSTKYLKFCYSGNYAGTYKNIVVTDQAYVNDPKVGDDVISSLDFGAGNISSGEAELTFDVEWCNVPALAVTSDNTLFTVTPASFGSTAKYGTQTVSVKYNRNVEVGEHSGTITLTNGTVTKTVTVSGSTTKRAQDIHWNADLTAVNFTMNAGDELAGVLVATADNEEAEVTFASDNTDVIAVSEDGKTLYAGANGTATITVTATGNDIYAEAQASQVFTVTSNQKQVIVWDQNFMSLKTTENPNTIELTATATSGGEVTYALEDGSDACVTLNGSTLTITGTPGVAYIIATQAGGEINGEVWIAATARKQIKVRDPQSACDEYALADQSYTFAKGHKEGVVNSTEFVLVGKPTSLTFYAKRGDLQYSWTTQTDMYIEQYANFGSGLEWKQVATLQPTKNGANYGPYALNETATKIRFRTGEYAEQSISNISVPRKKELAVSETNIVENGERNVRWTKTISVSRSNIDVVDIFVESADPNCQFEVNKTSIGTDCADRTTETFEVSITPLVRDSVYTGTITITDGKANPTTHTINLAVTAIGFNQSITGFDLPETCGATDEVLVPAATASSGLEVVYLSSDSTIAYVENGILVIRSAGTVDIIAYQAGNDTYNEASVTKTIVIAPAAVENIEAPLATEVKLGATLGTSLLLGGSAPVEGAFAWENPNLVPEEGVHNYNAVFTPINPIYAVTIVPVEVSVNAEAATYGIYTAYMCDGDSVEFDGIMYYSEVTDEVLTLQEQQNMYGGDSIVIFSIVVYPVVSTETNEVMYCGDTLRIEPNVWYAVQNEQEVLMDQAEYVLPNEATTIDLIQHAKTEHGCDKTIVRHISVEKKDATGVENAQSDDVQCTKVLRNGVLYILRDGKEYTITGLQVK